MERSDLEHWQRLMSAWDAGRNRLRAAGDAAAKKTAEDQLQAQQRQIAEFISARAGKRSGPKSKARLGLFSADV